MSLPAGAWPAVVVVVVVVSAIKRKLIIQLPHQCLVNVCLTKTKYNEKVLY